MRWCAVLTLFLLVVQSLSILCVAQQTCVSGHNFEKECACIPDVAGRMFEGWFGRRTSAYCSQQFPEVWTDFVDCFVDSVLAKGVTVPARYSSQEDVRPTFLPAVPRLVAIGDLHGDMQKARRAFRLGGLVDANDRWIGGTTTAVQVGDQLDRGDNEIQILYFLERLQREAEEAGGKLHVLNGNHETMNVAGRFTYATLPALASFYDWQAMHSWGANLKAKCGCDLKGKGPEAPPQVVPPRTSLDNTAASAARKTALEPGGVVTRRFLAGHPMALQIGSTLFVHGGVLPMHAKYGLERINEESRAWMNGSLPHMPSYLGGRQAVVWTRDFSAEDERRCDCGALQQALSMLPGAARMVVGHTIQEAGINSACDDRVFRIDVGLSKGCGNGEPQVLEILDDKEIRQLRENGPPKQYGHAEAEQRGWLDRVTHWRGEAPEKVQHT